MNEILKTILSMSCSGGLLIIIFFLLCPLYRRSLSKQWQYYIWLVVAARLLLPFALEINFMDMLFQRIENDIVQMELDPPSVLTESSISEKNMKKSESGSDKTNNESGSAKSNLQNEQPLALNYRIFFLFWLAAALILFIRKITVYQCFVRYIKAGCTEVSDIGLLEQLGTLIKQSGINTTVELYTNNIVSSPLLIGFFRPCIVLPTDELTDSEFHYTILHELTHFKRGDMFYKWIVQAAVCVHWFNPLVYFMSHEVERVCELSCDEAIIRNLDEQERRVYGDTLLNAIGRGGSYKNSIASVTLGESGKRAKERLDAIKNYQRKSRLVRCATAVFTIAICYGAAAMGVYAADPLSDSGSASSMKPLTIGDLTLLEKEYTLQELNDLNISNIIINTLSDDVTIVKGKDTLKFEYYVRNPDEYRFTELEDYFNNGQDRSISVERGQGSSRGNGRSMTVTMPDEFQLKSLNISTTSGNISLTDCSADSVGTTTQNGEINIHGGAVSKSLNITSDVGNALVSGTSLPDTSKNDSYSSYFATESGTIIFQPLDSADNYCFHINYGEEANVFINDEGYEDGYLIDSSDTESMEAIPGSEQEDSSVGWEKAEFIKKTVFTINENAGTVIKFKSPRGNLMVQEE